MQISYHSRVFAKSIIYTRRVQDGDLQILFWICLDDDDVYTFPRWELLFFEEIELLVEDKKPRRPPSSYILLPSLTLNSLDSHFQQVIKKSSIPLQQQYKKRSVRLFVWDECRLRVEIETLPDQLQISLQSNLTFDFRIRCMHSIS